MQLYCHGSTKIKDLKTIIESGALEHKDCLDRADMELRAGEAVARTCAFIATLDLRRLEVAAKVWDARRKQDSDYESDCSDESGPPGLDTGLDDGDDGPPGLEEDGAPPGGAPPSAKGSRRHACVASSARSRWMPVAIVPPLSRPLNCISARSEAAGAPCSASRHEAAW